MNGPSTSGNADHLKLRGRCDALGPAFPPFASLRAGAVDPPGGVRVGSTVPQSPRLVARRPGRRDTGRREAPEPRLHPAPSNGHRRVSPAPDPLRGCHQDCHRPAHPSPRRSVEVASEQGFPSNHTPRTLHRVSDPVDVLLVDGSPRPGRGGTRAVAPPVAVAGNFGSSTPSTRGWLEWGVIHPRIGRRSMKTAHRKRGLASAAIVGSFPLGVVVPPSAHAGSAVTAPWPPRPTAASPRWSTRPRISPPRPLDPR